VNLTYVTQVFYGNRLYTHRHIDELASSNQFSLIPLSSGQVQFMFSSNQV